MLEPHQPPLRKTAVIGSLSFFNSDNVELMKNFADKEFDLAIVDPPYGLGKRTTDGGGTNSQIKFMDDIRRTNWDDKTPDKEYWEQLFRVSKNQIIWGGNYFDLPPTRTIICWDKVVMIPTMSQIEIAWTSFDSPARLVKINNTDKNRFHPTQKPIELYEYLLKNYAEKGAKILDTHLGSGSIAIAIEKANRLDKMDFEFTGIEIDNVYFNKAIKRIEQYCRQGTLSF
jgi:site-specific DNA-methyltransferase (adenine-specific)